MSETRREELSTATRIGQLVESEKAVWVLYRGEGRMTIAVPASLDAATSSTQELQEKLERTFGEQVQLFQAFLRDHLGWVVLFSIPSHLSGADQFSSLVKGAGARHLAPVEGRDLLDLGMDLPLGEWADVSKVSILALEGDVDDDPARCR